MAKRRLFLSGFTLIELMLVVAIIALLAAISVPKFANLVTKSREASLRGKLGSVRSAITLYYVDMDGEGPGGGNNIHINHPVFGTDLVPKYLDEIPMVTIPTAPSHAAANRSLGLATADWPPNPAGPGNCAYHAAFFAAPTTFILCTHSDSLGRIWSQY